MRIAVLASGGGSNLESLLEHFAQPKAAGSGTIELVASDNAEAGALARATARGIATHVISEPRDGVALRTLLHDAHIDLVVLAGYLKLVPTEVVAAWPGRLLNVHPSLLPAFGGAGMYGMRVHAAVIAAGVRVSGATVHFVDDHFDRGTIAAQWPVPVYPDDTPASLAQRVLRIEHQLLPLVVEAVASGSLSLGADGRVSGQINRNTAPSPRAVRFQLACNATVAAAESSKDREPFADDVAHLFAP
jgi:formyltetrahydrofolate-dependent phosphoribosylglycinamide formyltransferase